MWKKILLRIVIGIILGMASIIANTTAVVVSEIGNIGDIGYVITCFLSWIFFVFFFNLKADKDYLKFPEEKDLEELKKKNEELTKENTSLEEDLEEAYDRLYIQSFKEEYIEKDVLDYYKNEALSRGVREWEYKS